MTALELHSQGPDVMWINRRDAIYKLHQADSLKYVKAILVEKQKDIDSLMSRTKLFEERLNNLMLIYTNNEEIILQKDDQIKISQSKLDLCTSERKELDRLLRKARRKTFWTAMAGVASTTAAILLFK